MKPSLLRLTAITLALVGLHSSLSAAELRISAAASLTNVLQEIAVLQEKATGEKPVLNLAGSNVLARQIEEGAPADVFFSADEQTLEGLRKKSLLMDDTITRLLSNTLVVIVPASSRLELRKTADLLAAPIQHLALGDPVAVPAGVYARKWLESQKAWEPLQGKVVGLENVRSALAAVEGSNAEAGIVYRTDAAISKKVRIAFEVPAAESPAIVYPIAVCKDATEPAKAKAFLQLLQRQEVTAIFEKHGFTVVTPASGK